MKYTVTNTINRPLNVVAAKFMEPDGALHWMEGLQKIERLSGDPYKVGAKSRFHSLHKNKEFVIDETILEQNMPHQIKFGFTSPMGYNEVEMVFEPIDDSTTRQVNNSYFQLKGFMKIAGPLMKGMFKKQSFKYLEAFREFAEK
ncbi:SRPBCC family protein [Zeaxanthinibacter enoshimensis]|uniref:Polyketide cyclase/dehydrase/lipid transport protein n=1 Tax=Zeaxanthinibacter enoshimensis TaxID=392009 RepID=A0A4R6TM12_9FLAO|nr:SRPBCC family protein [Zeaxanthinibacter enoshimensis]TDQ32215.1 hypothetical protein CLV82_0038 [Zeaxanthinibacter enoshimensis]